MPRPSQLALLPPHPAARCARRELEQAAAARRAASPASVESPTRRDAAAAHQHRRGCWARVCRAWAVVFGPRQASRPRAMRRRRCRPRRCRGRCAGGRRRHARVQIWYRPWHATDRARRAAGGRQYDPMRPSRRHGASAPRAHSVAVMRGAPERALGSRARGAAERSLLLMVSVASVARAAGPCRRSPHSPPPP